MTAKVQGRSAPQYYRRRAPLAVATALLALSLTLLPAPKARAEMYQWTDAEGRLHLTDNPYNIPPEYAEKVLERPPLEEPRDDTVQLVKADAGFVVTARLNGISDLRLIVDTGATTTTISPAAFRKGGLGAPLEKEIILLTAGGETRARTATVSTLAVGHTKNGPMTVVVHDAVPGYDGLLGMDYLGRYRFEIMTSGPKLKLTAQ